ncbi:hypothetical protein G2W53_041179 [Senna tora]|uniref:Retrotransposon gag domain-containing protein n=1 Tax=Senna tora TaxID=362788 RepID=A0A834VXS0_9FABA|nr:hypothetical protein G2W53_041179 [Senna tora]
MPPPKFCGICRRKGIIGHQLDQMKLMLVVLKCTEEQKVEFAIYKLDGEAEHWWRGAQQLMEARDVRLTWDTFKIAFLEKYNPMSVRNEKEIEFMQLKQGNMPFEDGSSCYQELCRAGRQMPHSCFKNEGAEKYKQKVSFNNKRPMNFSKSGNSNGKKPMFAVESPDTLLRIVPNQRK